MDTVVRMVALLLQSGTTCWFCDYPTATAPVESDMAMVTSVLDEVLSAELAGARVAMGSSAEEILLAALGRAVARAIGDGVLDVEVGGAQARRASVACSSRRSLSGHDLLATVRVPVERLDHPAGAEVYFRYDADGRGSAAPAECLLALHLHGDSAAGLQLDWRYDSRGFDCATVAELAEQFPLALIEVTSG